MSNTFQASLLDEVAENATVGELSGAVQRQELSDGAWVDVLPGWVSGADALFGRLVEIVPWRADRRKMYDRMVDVPRLVCWYGADDPLPDALLEQARSTLSDYYRSELGEPFVTAGLCFYRDGRDSVAWHGDRLGRSRHEDTMVAILSLGTPRSLKLRPRAGGASLRYSLGHGDLLVMGGSCQRTWEHCVPKAHRGAWPRISVQFRPRGVG